MIDGTAAQLPVIRGERIYLRGSERSDIPTFVRWFNDSETISYISMRAPMSEASEEQWFNEMAPREGKDAYHFVMCRLEDDKPIGTIGLFQIDQLNGNAGIGIGIGEKQLWGQGYGTDAMFALLDFGFGELRLERLWLEVYDYNARARRSYEKCGFVLEGIERHAIFKRGEYHDVHLMSILRDEWVAQERKKTWEYDAR
jgi:diamine N-acetyltransferase